MMPVWFFVGLIMAIYGLLILATGLLELSRPPSTVLGSLHPEIWWGAAMLVFGLIMGALAFRATRRRPS